MAWPPYRLVEPDHLAEAKRKHARLERLYHVGQERAWDGRQVLADLVAKHGRPADNLAPDKKAALAEIFTTILWGELAAWSISADLALELEDIEAKMAATSQTFDEARHFYVMRDYLALLDLGTELPKLDGYTHVVLTELLGTKHLVDKLLGMQLIVESVALTLFKQVASSNVEPVLAGLMPYFERDEARHVGLGVLYLPERLARLSRVEIARLALFQMKIMTFIGWGTHLKRAAFETLGIDNHDSMRRGLRLNQEVMADLRRAASERRRRVRGVLFGSEDMQRLNDHAIELFFPPTAAAHALPFWHRSLLRVTESLSRFGDRALRVVA